MRSWVDAVSGEQELARAARVTRHRCIGHAASADFFIVGSDNLVDAGSEPTDAVVPGEVTRDNRAGKHFANNALQGDG